MCRRASPQLALALVLAAGVAAGACGSSASEGGEAQTVADRFVDLYVIEVDQRRAIELTVGTARRRVAEELRAVADVRAQGYSAEAAKPRVFYDRVFLKVDDDAGRARAKYELRIDTGHAERKRELLLTLNKRDAGKWRVASFSFQDALDP